MQHTEDTPASVIIRFARYLNEGDIEGAVSLYDDDAVFLVEPGQVVRGRDDIGAALERFTSLNPTLTGDILKVVEAKDHAVVFNG